MKFPKIQNEATRSVVSAAIDRVVRSETRDFAADHRGELRKSLISQTKVEEFIFDEESGIGAFILTGTIDVFAPESKSQEQCSVWSVTADGTTQRIHYDNAWLRHHLACEGGTVYSAYKTDAQRVYKVSNLRIEENCFVVTHDDSRTLAISLEDAIADKNLMEENDEASRRSRRAPQDRTAFTEAAKKLVKQIGPKYGLGYDYASDVNFPDGRDDLCTVRWCSENGSSDGYDVIYLVWSDSSELHSRELCRGDHHKWAMTRRIEIDGDTLVINIQQEGWGSPIVKTIPLADLT